MLSDGQKMDFNTDGFLILDDALSPEELNSLRDACHEVEGDRIALSGDNTLAVIHDIVFKATAFMEVATHPVLTSSVSDLLGENLELQHCKLNWKPNAEGCGEVEWHQDFAFFPHTNTDLVAGMFLLDDAKPDNGCMSMIPGSHKWGLLSHMDRDGGFIGRCHDSIAPESLETSVDLIAPAGSLTLHHCLTVHSSYPNRSQFPRRGLVFQVRAADAVQLGGNVWKSGGMTVLGQRMLSARCVNATWHLPTELLQKGSCN